MWDYLACGVPIVAAGLPSIQEAAPGATVSYEPGDPVSLASALRAAHDDPHLRQRVLGAAQVRTWEDRARQLTAFLDGTIP